MEDGLTIIDRGALNGVLKRPVATLSAVAGAKFDQTTTLSITDNPSVTRKISLGATWFMALRQVVVKAVARTTEINIERQTAVGQKQTLPYTKKPRTRRGFFMVRKI